MSSDKCTSKVAQNWQSTVRWIESKHPEASTPHTKGLGQRMQLAASAIEDYLMTQSSNTMIHGDYKAANLFFSDDVTDGDPIDATCSASSVAAVDFQFTGAGVGAEDVAYLLYPDARGHLFDNEDTLLECYHDELISQLIAQRKGGPSTLSMRTFRCQYELSRLHLTCYWVDKGWAASTVGEVKLVTALENAMFELDGGKSLATTQEYASAAIGKYVQQP